MKFTALLTAIASQLLRAEATNDIGDQSQYQYTSETYDTAPKTPQFDWNITIDSFLSIDKPTTEQGIYNLRSSYILDDRSYDVELFKVDCETEPTGLDSFPLVFKAADQDIQGTKNNIELEWTYNQTKVEMSDIWTANKTGGYSEFCIRVNNYLPESAEKVGGTDEYFREIHFLEIQYKIEVDSLTDFNTTIGIKRINATDGGKEFINYEEEIEVYQCGDNYLDIGTPYPKLTQGDFLQLCVETVEESKFGVHSIKELDCSQDDDNLYPYVDSFVDAPLTFTSCKTESKNSTGAVCYAKMQLLSAYFDVENNAADLFCNGTVKLDYVGRRLSVDVPVSINMRNGDVSGRMLEEAKEDSSFGINVEISNEESESAGSVSVGGLFSAGMAFLAGGSMFTLA